MNKNDIFQFLFDLCAASGGDGDSALITDRPQEVAENFRKWLEERNEESENKFIYSNWELQVDRIFVRGQETITFLTPEEAKTLATWVDTIKTNWVL